MNFLHSFRSLSLTAFPCSSSVSLILTRFRVLNMSFLCFVYCFSASSSIFLSHRSCFSNTNQRTVPLFRLRLHCRYFLYFRKKAGFSPFLFITIFPFSPYNEIDRYYCCQLILQQQWLIINLESSISIKGRGMLPSSSKSNCFAYLFI